MTCYFPLHGYKGKSKDADKIAVTFSRPSSWKGERLDLPCGQCVGCRLERSRQWAVRCMHEASLYDKNSFITLTYDDKHLPPDGGLVLPHFQFFMKRLRKSIYPSKVRFYHCGEYGDLNARPHYHSLMFGYRPDDLELFSSRNNFPVFTSKKLSNLWPFGFSVVGDVSFDSAAYVARYVMKKVTGVGAQVHYKGRKPEYTTMSRRPGIGKGWYEKFKADIYPLDRLIVRGHPSRPPRYYDNLLAREDRSTFELLKIEREKNGQHFVTDVLSDGRVITVSDSDSFRLRVKEEVKRASLLNLNRPLEVGYEA